MHREARLEARLPHRQPAAKQAPPQARFLLQDLLQDRRALRPCLLCRDSSEGRRKPRRDGSKANRRRGRRPARRLSFRAASGRPFALRMTASRTARGRGETFPAARRKGACAPLSDRQRSEPQIVHQVPRPRLDRRLSLSQMSSGWRETTNRVILSPDVGRLQIALVAAHRVVPVASEP
jgi:hypothetical protein